MQGGLGIACKVITSIPGTCINLQLMERYKQLIQETYTEPQNEQIIGSFIFIEDGEQENPSEVTKNKKQSKSEMQ